jgi:hypothetical protein
VVWDTVKLAWQNISRLFPTLLVIYLPPLVLILTVGIISLRTGVPFSNFTRDTAGVAGVPAYVGIVSNLGILLWCAAAAVCLFTSRVLSGDRARREQRLFFFYAGLITIILLIDDLFMIHEGLGGVFRRSFGARYYVAGEMIVFASYAIAASLWLLRFKAVVLLHTHPIFLAIAIALFGLSLLFDDFVHLGRFAHLAEDSLKLLGIVGWLHYLVRAGFRQVTSYVSRRD